MYLNKVDVNQDNERYKCIENNKIIIGKSNQDQNYYDCLIFCARDIKNITIPNYIKHISSYAFNGCQNLLFFEIENESKLLTIDKESFSSSSIESITIPSHLVELKKGWCSNVPKLNRVMVSSYNKKYCCLDEKMIIGKSNLESDNYDCLVFCVRDIESVSIPDYIEYICPYAFENCKKLEKVEFTKQSKLRTICSYAFASSSIKSIIIPSEVTLIEDNAFAFCDKLQTIEINNNSKLQAIEENAFLNTKIESITIPSQLVELKEGWCNCALNLNKVSLSQDNKRYKCIENNKIIIGKSNQNQDNYDCLIFCARDIENITIPKYIDHISSYAFNGCQNLLFSEIENELKLSTIDKESFSSSSIESIKIPPEVISIDENAFNNCNKLRTVEFIGISKLKKIGPSAFSYSSIEQIVIPSTVTQIGEYAFYYCKKLEVIEAYVFCSTLISKITIPSEVTRIEKYAFQCCPNLLEIEIENDSKLQTIEEFVFYGSRIQSLTIPTQLVELKFRWSFGAEISRFVVSPDNPRYSCIDGILIIRKSNLERDYYDCIVFGSCDIERVKIPNYIEHIDPYAFFGSNNLQVIEFDDDSRLQTIGTFAFFFNIFKPITIPSNVTQIAEKSFSSIFADIYFSSDSKLQLIDIGAFTHSNIYTIKIPSNVIQIRKKAFYQCTNLKRIDFENDSKLHIIESEAFSASSIECMIIPAEVKQIGPRIFYNCRLIQIIEVDDNSKLEFIDRNAFDNQINYLLMVPLHLLDHLFSYFK